MILKPQDKKMSDSPFDPRLERPRERYIPPKQPSMIVPKLLAAGLGVAVIAVFIIGWYIA